MSWTWGAPVDPDPKAAERARTELIAHMNPPRRPARLREVTWIALGLLIGTVCGFALVGFSTSLF